jgi:cytochrome c-type biogenesis protein CcsB
MVVKKEKGWRKAAGGLTWAAAALLVFGIGMRCYIAGRPPVTNMYESIIWVSFGVMLFAGILFWKQRQAVILAVATGLTCFGLIAADAAPAMMDPGIHPLVPVLRSNYWLTIHVLTITLGYAAFALTLGLGNVALWQFVGKKAGASARIENLNQLTYRAMQFGVVLLAAGTILGGIWADYSWGRFWGWDPKEVWALIALLGYIAILHARYAGWVGQFGYAAWTVISFMLVVMAWYGVNFVLGVGLHSYGFSSGGRGTVGGFCLLQLAYVGGIWAHTRLKKPARAARA